MNHNLPPGTTPVPDDDLETTAQKLEILANVVEEGNSLALYTGLQLSAPKAHAKDAESMAQTHMTALELESYTEWKSNNTRLPPFDWENHQIPLPSSTPQNLKKYTRRAEAMDTVWNHTGARPEHASWLTFNLSSVLPLVKAVSRVQAAERQFQNDPLAGLGPMELAEIETVRTVVSIAEKTREREVQRMKRLTRSIARTTGILNSRMGELAGKARDGDEAEERDSVGGSGGSLAGGGVRLNSS